MKATFWPLSPATLYSPLMSSSRLVVLYVLVIWIWNVTAPAHQCSKLVSLEDAHQYARINY